MSTNTRTVEVDPEYDGVRLDSFLTAVLPEQSRSQIQRLIKDGSVTGAAKGLRPSMAVRAGQHYSIDIPGAHAGRAGARSPAAADSLRRSGHRRARQARWHGRAPGSWPQQRDAGQRAVAPRHRPERDWRRAASGDCPSARPRHVGIDGRGEARSGAPGTVAAISRPRSRQGIHRARLGRRPCRATNRRADRPRREGPTENVDAGAPGAQLPSRASRGRVITRASLWQRSRSRPDGRTRSACTCTQSVIRSSVTPSTAGSTAAFRRTSGR